MTPEFTCVSGVAHMNWGWSHDHCLGTPNGMCLRCLGQWAQKGPELTFSISELVCGNLRKSPSNSAARNNSELNIPASDVNWLRLRFLRTTLISSPTMQCDDHISPQGVSLLHTVFPQQVDFTLWQKEMGDLCSDFPVWYTQFSHLKTPKGSFWTDVS